VRDLEKLKEGENGPLALERLLEVGRYNLPLPVRKVGYGFKGLVKGLELMRRSVSGEELVVGV